MAERLVGFADESFAECSDGAGYYSLAIALVVKERLDEVQSDVRSLNSGNHRKLHWKDMHQRDRRIIAEQVGKLDVECLVVTGAPLAPRRQERARAKCLSHTLTCLSSWPIEHLFLESRTETLNRRDIATANQHRQRLRSEPTIRVDHVLPSAEPLVWVPDVVAGAYAGHRRGLHAPWSCLVGRVHVEEIDLGH